MTTLNSTALLKQKCCVACVTGKNDRRALYIASSESCKPNGNLFDVRKKLKESIFKSNNQINHTVTTRTWVLSEEWIRMWQNTELVSNETLWWYPFVSMVDAVLQGVWVKAMSLYLFWCLEQMLSVQFFWNIQRKTNYPRVIYEFQISHQTFVMMTPKIVRCNLNIGILKTS